MFGMFGLGAQEILLLGCCGIVPVVAAVVAVLAARRTGRPRTGHGGDEDGEF